MLKSTSKSTQMRFCFDFNILTALKGWVGHAPQGRGALHIIFWLLVQYLKKSTSKSIKILIFVCALMYIKPDSLTFRLKTFKALRL